jgi:hypothetical protein
LCGDKNPCLCLGIAVRVHWHKTCPRWLCSGGHNRAANVRGICQWRSRALKELLDRSHESMLNRGTRTVNLCRLHSFAETCKTNWFSRGPNGFGSGNVVSDTFVKWLPSGEECKWGQRTGAGAMGDGLAGRKDWRRQQRWVPRLNHHPWRRRPRLTHHPSRRRIAEVKLLGSGLEARRDRGG